MVIVSTVLNVHIFPGLIHEKLIEFQLTFLNEPTSNILINCYYSQETEQAKIPNVCGYCK